jgi:acyl-CoA synthetase (AMP-forming)/AMP-acid ligase II
MSNISQILWAAAARTPSQIAVEDDTGACTYEELRQQAAGVACTLRASGVKPGDRIAVLLERGIKAAAVLLGVQAAGALAVAVNERLQPRQIEYILHQCAARVLITCDEIRERHARPLAAAAMVLAAGELATHGDCDPIPRSAGDFAQIIYTSGSSGLPKGVTFTHGAMGVAVGTCASYLELRPHDRVASLLPFSSVYGLNQLLTTIAIGGTLVVELSPMWNDVAERLRERKITVLAAVPSLWLQLLSTRAFNTAPPRTLRIAQNAGGHLPVAAVRRIRELLPSTRLFLQYGQTETFRSSHLDPGLVDQHPDSMGQPIPGAEIFVVRADGSECAPGEEGELVFRGPTMAAGYWNDPERTAQVFRALRGCGTDDVGAQAVFSGDRVRRDRDGLLYFVARAERLIKTMGFRVGPDEVVDVLLASGRVREALVTAEPDTHRGERIVAHVVLEPGGDVAEVLRYCKLEMPSHMVPARVEVYETLPCLTTGKYDVNGLRRQPSSTA